MIRGFIFKCGHFIKRPGVIPWYNKFQKTQWYSLDSLQNHQDIQLRELIKFAYQNVPYYTEVFNKYSIRPDDINGTGDLEKLPVLNKQIIKQRWYDFVPRNINELRYVKASTGGSTGVPLKYYKAVVDHEMSESLLYRGWGYAGYKLGDKVAIIAGSSLIPTVESGLKRKIQDFILNESHYSAYTMSKENLYKYFFSINKQKPKFFRGYASAIYVFAKFLQNNNLKLNFKPEAVFTTSEKLFSKQKIIMAEALGAEVFDNYGLSDGGVSAFECKMHCGMHISMERSIMEVVDDENKNVVNQTGKILATSLYNYAFPFIRYDTGDLGIISPSKCTCGRQMPLLQEIAGRITDFLELNGVIIGSPVLTVLMGKLDIEQYQIIQENSNTITCKIIKGKTFSNQDEIFIKESFIKHVGNINVKFNYVNSIPLVTESGKHKFIINESGQI